jgi:hypothetical protein
VDPADARTRASNTTVSERCISRSSRIVYYSSYRIIVYRAIMGTSNVIVKDFA